MPFRSEAQRRWMYAKHPGMAKRWEKETPPGKLPDHAGDRVRRMARKARSGTKAKG